MTWTTEQKQTINTSKLGYPHAQASGGNQCYQRATASSYKKLVDDAF